MICSPQCSFDVVVDVSTTVKALSALLDGASYLPNPDIVDSAFHAVIDRYLELQERIFRFVN
jgi:hypothetical protein